MPNRLSAHSAALALPPPLTLFGLEPLRAAWEYAQLRMARRACSAAELPQGDGHTVVVFPGLATDQRATAPLLSLCKRLGYDARDWGRGRNTGPRGEPLAWLDELAAEVCAMGQPGLGRLSLVGWSLGGIYARELAKRLGPRVRQVISIGSPFAGSSELTHAGLVYRLLNGRKPVLAASLRRQLRQPPEAPTTSIYSRSDGVVAWQACVQPGRHAQVENIEVQGSHCGLCWNAQVHQIVADRLSQAPGRWQPYRSAAG